MINETTMRKRISANLRKARLGRNLSQSELARAASLMPSAVAHFESGRRMPSCYNLLRLAESLDVSLDHLFGRDSARTPKGKSKTVQDRTKPAQT